MPRNLADGRLKFTVLSSSPANPAGPTAVELNAGGAFDLSFKVLQDSFQFGPVDSEKVAEKALADVGNANAIGASNYQIGFTLWRYWLTAGGIDPTADAAFTALKTKGGTFWAYGRLTDKLAQTAWATGDEIFFGCEWTNDIPQRPDGGGWIKYRIPGEVQRGYPFISVAAEGSAPSQAYNAAIYNLSTYFTARKTATATAIRVPSGATAAGATPTLVRFGLYSVDPTTGNLTLMSAGTSDTSAFAAAGSSYSQTLAAAQQVVAGQRYAIGVLVVTSASAPTICGTVGPNPSEVAQDPRLAALLSGQTDLPASITSGLTDTASMFYAALV